MDAPSTPCRPSTPPRPHRRRKDHAVDGDQVKEWSCLSGYQNPCLVMKSLKMIVKYRDIRNPDAKVGDQKPTCNFGGSETSGRNRGIKNRLAGSGDQKPQSFFGGSETQYEDRGIGNERVGI